MKSLVNLVQSFITSPSENQLIIQTLQEITSEMNSSDIKIVLNASKKLIFVYQLYHDISPFSFISIKLLCNQQYLLKRYGYLTSHFTINSTILAVNTVKNDILSKDTKVAKLALSLLYKEFPNQIFDILLTMKCNERILAGLLKQSILLNKTDDFIQYLLTNIGFITQKPLVFIHCCFEISKQNQKAIQLLPAIYNIFTSSANPWEIIECVKFMKQINSFDKRIEFKVKSKVQNQLSTNSYTLLMELVKFIADMEYNEELYLAALQKMSHFILHQTKYTDENLKILSMRNINLLQQKQNGLGFQIPGLVENVILQLQNDDFTIKMCALSVIETLSNSENLMNITHKIIKSVFEIDQQKVYGGFKEIQKFCDKSIEIIVWITSKNNFQEVQDFQWLMQIYIKLLVELPQFNSNLVIDSLYNLCEQVQQIQLIIPEVLSQILQNKFYLTKCAINLNSKSEMSTNLSALEQHYNASQIFDDHEFKFIAQICYVIEVSVKMIDMFFVSDNIKNSNISLTEITRLVYSNQMQFYSINLIQTILFHFSSLIIKIIKFNEINNILEDSDLSKSIDIISTEIEKLTFYSQINFQYQLFLEQIKQKKQLISDEKKVLKAMPDLLQGEDFLKYNSTDIDKFLSRNFIIQEDSEEIFIVSQKIIDQPDQVETIKPIQSPKPEQQIIKKQTNDPFANDDDIELKDYLQGIKIDVKQEQIKVQLNEHKKRRKTKKQ